MHMMPPPMATKRLKLTKADGLPLQLPASAIILIETVSKMELEKNEGACSVILYHGAQQTEVAFLTDKFAWLKTQIRQDPAARAKRIQFDVVIGDDDGKKSWIPAGSIYSFEDIRQGEQFLGRVTVEINGNKTTVLTKQRSEEIDELLENMGEDQPMVPMPQPTMPLDVPPQDASAATDAGDPNLATPAPEGEEK